MDNWNNTNGQGGQTSGQTGGETSGAQGGGDLSGAGNWTPAGWMYPWQENNAYGLNEYDYASFQDWMSGGTGAPAQKEADYLFSSYWDDPLKVAKFWNAWKDAPNRDELMPGVWGRIDAAYNYYKAANQGAPWQEWKALDKNDPARQYLAKIGDPPAVMAPWTDLMLAAQKKTPAVYDTLGQRPAGSDLRPGEYGPSASLAGPQQTVGWLDEGIMRAWEDANRGAGVSNPQGAQAGGVDLKIQAGGVLGTGSVDTSGGVETWADQNATFRPWAAGSGAYTGGEAGAMQVAAWQKQKAQAAGMMGNMLAASQGVKQADGSIIYPAQQAGAAGQPAPVGALPAEAVGAMPAWMKVAVQVTGNPYIRAQATMLPFTLAGAAAGGPVGAVGAAGTAAVFGALSDAENKQRLAGQIGAGGAEGLFNAANAGLQYMNYPAQWLEQGLGSVALLMNAMGLDGPNLSGQVNPVKDVAGLLGMQTEGVQVPDVMGIYGMAKNAAGLGAGLVEQLGEATGQGWKIAGARRADPEALGKLLNNLFAVNELGQVQAGSTWGAGQAYYEAQAREAGWGVVTNAPAMVQNAVQFANNLGGMVTGSVGVGEVLSKGMAKTAKPGEVFKLPEFTGDGRVIVYPDPVAAPGFYAAAGEYRDMLTAGMPDTLAAEAVRRKYGFSGEMADLMGQMALDPLNLMPHVERNIMGRIGTALDNPTLELAAKTAPGGWVDTLQTYGTLKRAGYGFLDAEGKWKPAVKIGFVDRMLSGLTKEGTIRELTPGQIGGQGLAWAVAKEPLNPLGWIKEAMELTPQSRAKVMLELSQEQLGQVLGMAGGDPTAQYDLMKRWLAMTPEQARQTGEAIGMPEAMTVRQALVDQVKAVDAQKAAWLAGADHRAILLETAQRLGVKPAEALDLMRETGGAKSVAERLKNLTPNPLPEREGGPAAGLRPAPEAISVERLGAAVKYFESNPWHPEQASAILHNTLLEGVATWTVDKFGVVPDTKFNRFFTGLKSIQSLALLGLNPAYVINNAIDNGVKRAMEGVWGYVGQREIDRFFSDFGIEPARLKEGSGAADVGTRQGGLDWRGRREQVKAGTVTKEQGAARAEAVIGEARRANDAVQSFQEWTRAVGGKGPMTGLASVVEGAERGRAMYYGVRGAWARIWPDLMPGLPESLRAKLAAIDPNLPRAVEAMARGGVNMDQVRGVLMGQAAERTAEGAARAAAMRMGVDGEAVVGVMRESGALEVVEARLLQGAAVGDAIRAGQEKARAWLDERAAGSVRAQAEAVRAMGEQTGGDLTTNNTKYTNEEIAGAIDAAIRAAGEAGISNREDVESARGRGEMAQAVEAAAAAVGLGAGDVREMMDAYGVGDQLRELGRQGLTPEQAAEKVRKDLMQQAADLQGRDLLARQSEARAVVQNEQLAGLLNMLGDMQMKTETHWAKHFAEWEAAFEAAGAAGVSKKDKRRIIDAQRAHADESWQLHKEWERATYLGMLQGLGFGVQADAGGSWLGAERVESAGDAAALRFGKGLMELHKSWDEFFRVKAEQDARFFGRADLVDVESDVWQREYQTHQENLGRLYDEYSVKENRYLAQMGADFAEAWAKQYGPERAGAAARWWGETANLAADRQGLMSDFRAWLRGAPATELKRVEVVDLVSGMDRMNRGAVWPAFLKEVYLPHIGKMVQAGLDGAWGMYSEVTGASGAASGAGDAVGMYEAEVAKLREKAKGSGTTKDTKNTKGAETAGQAAQASAEYQQLKFAGWSREELGALSPGVRDMVITDGYVERNGRDKAKIDYILNGPDGIHPDLLERAQRVAGAMALDADPRLAGALEMVARGQDVGKPITPMLYEARMRVAEALRLGEEGGSVRRSADLTPNPFPAREGGQAAGLQPAPEPAVGAESAPVVEAAPEVAQPVEVAPVGVSAPAGVRTGGRTEALGNNPNQRYDFIWRVVEAGDLVASHDRGLNVNREYPAELQPRDRERAASLMQVNRIAQALSPDALLVDTHRIDSGAPIVGPDLVVESGNGRTIAVQIAAADYPERFAAYKAELVRRAAEYGIDPATVEGMSAPVLVRERATNVDRVQFATEANQSATLRMGGAETAASDARRITEGMLGALQVKDNQNIEGAIMDAGNRGLVRAFLAGLPEGERAGLIDAGGQLNQDGVRRIKNALLAATLPGEAGGRLLRTMSESTDTTIGNIEKALAQSLPAIAQAEAMVRRGERDAGLAIGADLAAAVDMLARLKNQNMSVKDYLNQGAMFGRELTAGQEKLLAFLNEAGRGTVVVKDMLGRYAELVMGEQNTKQMGLFGDMRSSKEQILERAIQYAEARRDEKKGTAKLEADNLPEVMKGAVEGVKAQAEVEAWAEQAGAEVGTAAAGAQDGQADLSGMMGGDNPQMTQMGADNAQPAGKRWEVQTEGGRVTMLEEAFGFDHETAVAEEALNQAVAETAARRQGVTVEEFWSRVAYVGQDAPGVEAGVRGAFFQTEEGKRAVTALKNADADTWLHESFHLWFDLALSDLERGRLMKAAGVKTLDADGYRAVQEWAAERYVNWRMEGGAPNERVRAAFEKVRGFMQEVTARVAKLLGLKVVEVRGKEYGRAAKVFEKMFGLQTWEMTAAEAGELAATHEKYVRSAMMNGEAAPARVIAEYPRLVTLAQEMAAKGKAIPVEWAGAWDAGLPEGVTLSQAAGRAEGKQSKGVSVVKLSEALTVDGVEIGGMVFVDGEFAAFAPADLRTLRPMETGAGEMRVLGVDGKGNVVVLGPEGQVITRALAEGERVTMGGGRLVMGGLGEATGVGGYESQMMGEGMQSYVLPVLREMGRSLTTKYTEGTKGGSGGQAATGSASPTGVMGKLDQAGRVDALRWLGEVEQAMSQAKLAAVRLGQNKADAALLNYNRKTGFDQAVTWMFPYQFWQTRSMIQWALRLADRPALLAHYAKVQAFMSRRYDEGFPERLKGKIGIPAPFLPEWTGRTLYVDPLGKVFQFQDYLRILDRQAQDQSRTRRGAEAAIARMAEAGRITTAQAQEALGKRSGVVWEQAMAQAGGDEQADPLDLLNLFSSSALYVSLPIRAMTGQGGKITSMPFSRNIQAMAAATGMPGVKLLDLESKVRSAAGLPQFGQWGDYYIDRQLANMVGSGERDLAAVKLAMVERSGPVYEEAVRRVELEQAMGVPGAAALYGATHGAGAGELAAAVMMNFIPASIISPGELKLRGLGDEWKAATAAYKAGDGQAYQEFFAKYPEYEARLAQYDDPEARLRNLLVGNIWEQWSEMGPLYQRAAKEQLGTLFNDAFMSKETRDYSAIKTETLAQWAQLMGAYVPRNVTTAQGELKLPAAEVANTYDAYLAQRAGRFPTLYGKGATVLDKYYAAGEAQQAVMRGQYPEIGGSEKWRDAYLAAHPEIIPYAIGKDNKLQGASEKVQAGVYAYRAEREKLFPGLMEAMNQYYSLGPELQGRFKQQYPGYEAKVKEYQTWSDQYLTGRTDLIAWVKSEESMARAFRLGGQQSGVGSQKGKDKTLGLEMSPALASKIYQSVLSNKPLTAATRGELFRIWEAGGRPGAGTFEDWYKAEVLPLFRRY